VATHENRTTKSSKQPVIIALLLGTGLALGHSLTPAYLPLLIITATTLTLLYLLLRLIPNYKLAAILCTLALGTAWVSLAASWWVLRYDRLPDNNIASAVNTTPHLWHLQGTITTAPVIRTKERGIFARYSYRKPVTYFQMKVNHALLNNGKIIKLTGRVLVHLKQADHTLHAGDQLEVFGPLSAFPAAHNPGEYDRAQLARFQGLAGIITIGSPDNIHRLKPIRLAPSTLLNTILRWRENIRTTTTGWLNQDIPDDENQAPESLLAALLLGQRAPPLDDIQQSFRTVGLAHVLAVSGLHLGILVVTVLLIVRFLNLTPLSERLIILALVILYLTIVPARIPVWRAGVMLIVFQLASHTGRRISAVNILAWTAIILMIWKPSEITQPGFQLSFGNVFALLILTRPFRNKLFGPPHDIEILPEHRIRTILAEWCKTFIAAIPVPWLVSLPLVAYYFHTIPLIGIIATILVAPFVALILALGFLKIIATLLFPSLSFLLAPILLWNARTLINLVSGLENIPFAAVAVPPPSLAWTLITTIFIIYFIIRKPLYILSFRRILINISQYITTATILVLWLFLPNFPSLTPSRHQPPDAQVTMLSVGNGSCYIIQSHQQTALYDAGSGGFFGAGEVIINPALKQLGISKVETIIISHGDIDHYGGAVAVMKAFHTKNLIIPPQMIITAQQKPKGPVAFLLNETRKRNITITPAARGFILPIGQAQLHWLNPIADYEYERSNNSSAVIHLQTPAGTSMLFTGDLQPVAMHQLERDYSQQQLHADIMELPHHGGWSTDAAEFFQIVNPTIILQSVGNSRLRNDRWESILKNKQRYITAQVGATTCTINRDGTISVKTFTKQ